MSESLDPALQPVARERVFGPRGCHSCGTGVIAVRSAEGQVMPHRDATALRIDVPVMVPMCSACGEMLLDARDLARLDTALEAAYRAERGESVPQ